MEQTQNQVTRRNMIMTMIVFLILVLPGIAGAKTIYMGPLETYKNLQAAMAAMSANDTLVIRDGTYTGASNIINQTHRPPDGTGSSFTTIMAEHDGMVFFDGQNANQMFFLQMYSSPYKVNRLYFRGINWIRNANDGVLLTSNGGSGNNNTYIKFVRCGAQGVSGATGNWDMNYTDHLLMEECFSFGDSRYGIILFGCNNAVIRRCVVRLDAASSGLGYPIAGIQIYDTQYAEIQNSIVLDSDDQYFGDFAELEGAFDTHKYNVRTTQYVYWRGNIALNIRMSRSGPSTGWQSTAGGYVGGSSVVYSNNIFWDATTYLPMLYPGAGSCSIDHSTFGKIKGPGIGLGTPTTNNIFTAITGTAVAGAGSISYNAFYGNGSNGSTGTNTKTSVNPIWSSGNPTGALKHLVRIEAASNLSGQGSSGDIGATVMTKIGVDGTFYGDPGYNSDTGNPLWPFPHEGVMKTVMAGYSVAGGPPGARGFATGTSKDGSPQTLTKYIWEYLGNQIPSDIYAGGDGLLSPPTSLRVVQ
jgi:hypothetical protein